MHRSKRKKKRTQSYYLYKMFFKTKLITAAAATPITLAEAKAHLRVDTTTEDTLITTLINAATEYAEKRLARALITQTWEQYLDEFPSTDSFEIKFPPLQSITSIKYYDADNVLQTWDSTNYDVDIKAEPGTISLSNASTGYPSTFNKPNAVIIKYVAGYGDASTDVPELIRAGIKLLVSHFFENREGVQTMGSVQDIKIPHVIETIFNHFTVRDQL